MKTKLFIIAIIVLLCGQNFLYSQECWQYLDGLSDQYLWKVYAQSPDTVYITGASSKYNGQGMIAKSTNGGINWIKTYPATNNLLKDIAFYDKNIGFVVGKNGVVLKTTNGGIDWQLKTTGTTQNLNAISLTGINNIWAVGDGGVVIQSTDEGVTWQVKNFSITDNFNDIIFSGSEGYIVGDNGSFWKTMDYGITWNNENTNISDKMYTIQKTGNNMYLLVGDNVYPRVLLEKQNTGNWNSYYGELNGFYMINDTLGYISNSVLLTNGGENVIFFNKLGKNTYSPPSIYRSWILSLDINHSDMSVANDTMIYVISGSVLLKSSPNMTTNLKETIINNGLVVFESPSKNELTVKSNLQPISVLELFNSSGNKVSMKRMNSKVTETMIDISKLPIGVYLLKVTLANNIQHVHKCIKD